MQLIILLFGMSACVLAMFLCSMVAKESANCILKSNQSLCAKTIKISAVVLMIVVVFIMLGVLLAFLSPLN